MRDLSKKTYQISLGAMLSVLALIALYLSAILPAGRITFYFLSGIFLAPLLFERQLRIAVIVYIATSLLSLLVLPGMVSSLPYILLFGHYGIGKFLIEENCKKKRAYLLKWIYYNISIVLVYFVCFSVLAGEWMAGLAWPWLFVLAQVAFVIYDYVYSYMILLYHKYLRRALMG